MRERWYHHAGDDTAFQYRGELSELDVLGISEDEVTTEAEIRRALAGAQQRLRLPSGSRVLLIQSGAAFPDGPLVSELQKRFVVTPFSGVPSLPGWQRAKRGALDAENYSKNLRLAAARGGNEFIICCWGVLESARENLHGKAVSWVPFVDWVVPDERQHMRIRLKLAVLEVASGAWTILSPEPLDDARISIRPKRGAADQHQVDKLKKEAYENAVRDLLNRNS